MNEDALNGSDSSILEEFCRGHSSREAPEIVTDEKRMGVFDNLAIQMNRILPRARDRFLKIDGYSLSKGGEGLVSVLRLLACHNHEIKLFSGQEFPVVVVEPLSEPSGLLSGG